MELRTAKTLGILAMVVGTPVALLTHTIGWVQTGWEPAAVQCQKSEYPDGIDLYSSRVSGEKILYPLGLSCTYAASETSPGITIRHYRWDATALFTAAAALALAGTVVALRAERKQELITESPEDRATT
ncbi:hypothetical protein [Rathayibacter sp. AY1D9]|uniref:hypothetical protein n=1 Tax=Rathayibacter sp. AY1D9 TaxID=2080548 RepID=UPI000CE7982A|nr:hypothetical protein [Rathayibacter sp. AY1D9]PPH79355.1 hypothetical protein C5C50_13000 [Rathayibacter sp. AY1D9]